MPQATFGLAGYSDDQLMGIISAARRQESRDAWTVMAAIGEFARRAGTGDVPPGQSPNGGCRTRRRNRPVSWLAHRGRWRRT
jgi:hypothetical protein